MADATNKWNEPQADEAQRWEVLHDLERWVERPVQWLGLVWLGLLVLEYTWGLSPLLNSAVWIIWVLFVAEFLLRLILAPRKLRFLQNNWLTVISLAVPALRIFAALKAVRLLRLGQTMRSAQLVRVVGSINRSMNTLRIYLVRHQTGYIVALTVLVVLVGAAGMWALEGVHTVEGGFANFGDALWWTAMIMTTMGSAYWPQTFEGRMLAFLLSAYALSIFGYITAFLASYFVGRDTGVQAAKPTSAEEIAHLSQQIEALRRELRERVETQK
jgi:voltage-gated potassium channel